MRTSYFISILGFALLLCFSIRTQGQDLVVNLLDGQTEQYAVNGIRTVKFVNNYLVMHQNDDVMIGWHIGDILNYEFDMSTVSTIDQEARMMNVLRIYPNPSSSWAQIEYISREQSDISIEIFDTRGRLVEVIYQGAHAEETKAKWNILSEPGTYLCRVRSANKVVTGKIIVQ